MWIFRCRATRGSWTVLLDSEISYHAVGKPRVLGHDRPEYGAGAMRPRSAGSLLTVLVLVLVLVSLLQSQAAAEVGTLPAPSGVSIQSIDMRHTLWWRPLEVTCDAGILYSVQFQGEFELTFLNGRWLDATECQLTPRTHCDLSLDLGSDSDYNLRVRAQCGSHLSDWVVLDQPFNRKHTVLTMPTITVSVEGHALKVAFDKLPAAAVVILTMWRSDGELKTDVHSVSAQQAGHTFTALQVGAEYCVRAQTVLENQLQNSSTDVHCRIIPGPDAAAGWRTPTAVTGTTLALFGLLFAVFWTVVHCGPDVCKTYFKKEPLPTVLPSVWDVQTPIIRRDQEVFDHLQVMERTTPTSDDADVGRPLSDTSAPPAVHHRLCGNPVPGLGSSVWHSQELHTGCPLAPPAGQ